MFKEKPEHIKQLEKERLEKSSRSLDILVKQVEEERKTVLNNLIYMFYNNFKEYFETGDMIFTGSLIHNLTGLQKKEKIDDLDISVVQGEYGDEILEHLKKYLTQPNIEVDGKYVEKDWPDGKRAWYMNRYVVVDIFRNKHPKEFSEDIQVEENIITKYYGHKWIYDITYEKYLIWKSKDIKKQWIDEKLVKLETLLKNMKENGKI